jgi:hypothetical protein
VIGDWWLVVGGWWLVVGGWWLVVARVGTRLQRSEYRRQIYNRLIVTDTIASLRQQSSLNRRQVIKVEHLLGDRVDQYLTKPEEERQGLYFGPRQDMLFPVPKE